MRIIVFDTEATSLTPGQICQLSYLCVDDGQVTGKNYFFSVDEMSEGSQEVHGLSMDMLEELSGGRYFEDDAQSIFDDFRRANLMIDICVWNLIAAI
jgi:DNA polymerase-3 subunit epsilon